MSKSFWTSTKSSEKPSKSNPAATSTETDAIPTVDSFGCPPANPSKMKNVVQVETEKGPTPIVGTSSYQANSSKKNAKKTHAGTKKTAVPTVNTSSCIANQSKKEVNMVHIGAVNNGVVSFGNQFVSNYMTYDFGGHAGGFPPGRRRILPTMSEELKSSTLPLSVNNKYHIADHIGNNWKRLARTLPDTCFSDGQLETLRQSSENQVELVVNILNKWHEAAPSTATVGNLAKTLERMRLNDLAMGLQTE